VEELSYKGFAKSSILVTSAYILQSLKGIIFLPFITKILGTYSYGIWVQVGVIVGLLMPIGTLALTGALTRFLAGEEDKEKIQEGFYSIIFLTLGVSLLLALCLWGLSQPVARAFFDGERLIVILAAFVVPLDCLNTVLLMYFRTFRQMKKYSIFTVLRAYVELGLLIYVVLAGYGIVELVAAMLVARLGIGLAMFGFILPEVGFRTPRFSRIKEFLRFSLPIVPVNMSGWVISASDRLLISYFMGALFVGYYSPGYSLGTMTAIFLAPIVYALPPYIYNLYEQGKMAQVKSYLSYSLKYYLMLAIPAAFGLCVLSRTLLLSLSNPDIANNGYFIVFFTVSLSILYAINSLITLIIELVRKTKVMGISSIIAAAVNFGLNLIFIPWLGIIGAAITTLIAGIVDLGIRANFALRYFTFPVDWVSILKSIAASVIMVLGIWYFNPSGILEIILSVIGGAIVYGVIIILSGGVKKSELKFFKGLLPSKNNP